MTITKFDAIHSLRPECGFGMHQDGTIDWFERNTEQLPTDAEIDAELARLQAEYDAKEYQRQRAKAYPSIADQLDTLYHQGYDGWKATITAVKEEFPKP